ncbi:MAG TPA: arginine--tRNA ligase [bacterium]|nr:arginine--tRNA ligase [bacterium]
MNEIKKLIISQLAKIIKDKLGIESSEIELAYPVFAKQGDLALACFALAKGAAKSPVEIAQIIAGDWNAIDEVSEVKAEGPYVNFYINTSKLAPQLFANFAESVENIGRAEKVMIEFANVNTHKEFHIGHLRNVAFGQAVTGLLGAAGYDVLPVSYVNDFGIHTAKTIWQLSKAPIDQSAGINRGYLLGQAYVASVAAMGDDEQAKKEVSAIMTEIEGRSGENYKLWQETREWSIEYFQSIYDKLKIKFSHYYYESDLIDRGRELAKELLAKGVLQESQGAVIADLSAEDLGVLVILRQDGTALYPVADLALAMEKFASAKLAKSLYVVDKRQSLYFKQLFAVLKKMGYEAPMIHLPYDFVTLPSGMMSSRSGNTVLFNDVYNECKNSFLAETKTRHEDWSAEKIDEVAEKLTMATLKFEMIKVSAEKIITFNIKEALRFEGYTAAYLQYSCARINSVLAKAGDWMISTEALDFAESAEKTLVVALAKYPEVIAEAASKYEPSILTQYLFDVAQLFNDFYQTCPILSAAEEVKNSRLALAGHAQRVLTQGLATIGIEVIAEM